MLIPPKRIVFTGGGLRSLSHYGVLEVLEKRGLLKNIKEYLGVSAGALIGFTMILGYTIQEAQKTVVEFDWTILQNAHPELVFDFFSQYGVDSGEQIEKFLKSLLKIKGISQDITFGEWVTQYPKAIRLRCFACDMNTGEMKEFSYEKTPHISLVFALRCSMSLPIYFVPMKDPDTGHFLVDGGLIQNFPMNYLTEEEKETALGISFLYSKQKEEKITDFTSFLSQIYSCSFNPRTYQVQKDNKERCIIVPSFEMTAYNFDFTREFREALIDVGRKAAETFCDSYVKMLKAYKRPIRRFSVH